MAIMTAITAIVAVAATYGAATATSSLAMYALSAVALGSALKVTGDIVKSKELSMAGSALALAGGLVAGANAMGAFDGFSGAEGSFSGPGGGMGPEAIVSPGQDAGVALQTASTAPPVGSPADVVAASNIAATPAGGVPVGSESVIANGGGGNFPNITPDVAAGVAGQGPVAMQPPVGPAPVGAVNPVAAIPTPTAPTPPDPNAFMKTMAMMTGAQALSGLAGGYFAGVSAEEQLEFQKLMNQQKYAQAQEVLERGRYAPRVAFKGAPSGGVPATTPGMIGAA